MAVDIGPRIGIDGEKEFRDSINNLTQQVKTFGSELKAVDADQFSSAEEKAAQKSELLGKAIEAQKDKVEKLKQGLAESAEKYGETDNKTLKWKQSVAEAEAQLGSLEGQLSTTNKSIEASGDAAEKSGGKWDKLQEGLGTAGKALAAVGTAAVAAASAVGAAVVSKTKDIAEYGDNIDKMSQKLGISAEAYQEWEFIAEHSGTSMDSLKTSFKTLAKAAQDGSKDQQEALQSLGISLEEAASMSTEDLFSAVVTGLQGMEEGTERTALATQLLGKGAQELGALFNTSAADTEAMREQIHELGGVMSNEAVKDAAAFQDSLQNMQTAMDGLTRNMMSAFLPEITSVMDGLTMVLSGNMEEGTKLISDGVNGFAEKLIEGMPGVLDSMTEIMGNLVTVIIDNLPKIIETGITILIQLAVGLVKAIPQLVGKIPEIIKAIVEAFKKYDWAEIGRNVIDGLKNGLINSIENVKKAVQTVCTSIGDKFKSFFGIASPSKWARDVIGGNIMAGVGKGFEKSSTMAMNAAEKAAERIGSAFENGIPSMGNGTAYAYGRMADQLSGLRVVLDSGTLVGSIAPAMDKTFGGYTNLKARYNT